MKRLELQQIVRAVTPFNIENFYGLLGRTNHPSHGSMPCIITSNNPFPEGKTTFMSNDVKYGFIPFLGGNGAIARLYGKTPILEGNRAKRLNEDNGVRNNLTELYPYQLNVDPPKGSIINLSDKSIYIGLVPSETINELTTTYDICDLLGVPHTPRILGLKKDEKHHGDTIAYEIFNDGSTSMDYFENPDNPRGLVGGLIRYNFRQGQRDFKHMIKLAVCDDEMDIAALATAAINQHLSPYILRNNI